MVPNEPNYCATLTVHGEDWTCEDTTRVLGLKPTDCFRRGEPAGGEEPVHFDTDCWSIQAPATEEDSAEAQLEAMVAVLRPQARRFSDLPPQVLVTMMVSTVDRGEPVYVPTECLEFLGQIGAGLQVA